MQPAIIVASHLLRCAIKHQLIIQPVIDISCKVAHYLGFRLLKPQHDQQPKSPTNVSEMWCYSFFIQTLHRIIIANQITVLQSGDKNYLPLFLNLFFHYPLSILTLTDSSMRSSPKKSRFTGNLRSICHLVFHG